MSGKVAKAKQYKKELVAAFIAGIILLFAVNNWTTQSAYDFISCTWNQNDCPGCGEITGWDGECTDEIEDECCMDVDMCNGQHVQDYYDCYHYYCTSSTKFCAVVDQGYNEGNGESYYVCGCTSTGNGDLLY